MKAAVKKQPCIVIAGPTACGKTSLSVRLAKKLNGAVISADSMQVYRGLDIGSAKIRPEEMCGIPHYLIDVLDPHEPFDVYRFSEMAQEAAGRILAQGRIPIIAGGTGFYIQAFLRGINFTDAEGGGPLRRELEDLAAREGSEKLHSLLAEVDPASAEAIHPNNIKRVVRALEFYRETGTRISDHNAIEKKRKSPYCFAYFVLTDDRARLYERINARVLDMVKRGLEEEVRALYESGLTEDNTSMKGIGYKEWFPYFRGEITKEEAVRRIMTNSRHFAKRQLTWFRREKDVIWIDRSEYPGEEEMADYMAGCWETIQKRDDLI